MRICSSEETILRVVQRLTFVSDPNCIPTEGGCTLEFNDISTYNWKSAGFDGTTEYPICSTCTQDMTGVSVSVASQDIQLMSGETYTVETPDFKKNIFTNLNCEYNFIAPEGKQIEIKKLITKVKVNTECTSDFLLVNGDGDRRYPMDTSTIICDDDTRINHLTTNTNNLLVAYQKTGLDSRGFKMIIMAT
ncbi:hypothetical protein Pmani_001818 [Petrolisthes manimaculis]|uniref:CUB domain-containing protein n=1 Tax=Petrolisthes manimaculis TaxID=1843537 RepID=A0AAE1QMD3_9EUCA|nr:hypothetical protein Pmani_001818 [Petrolisthes manimaculis]